jgi:hypothetical protein
MDVAYADADAAPARYVRGKSPRISPRKSLAPYRECRGWKSLAERNKVRAAALSIGAT